jgi:hypothetical protein
MEMLDIALAVLVALIAWSLINEDGGGGKRSRGRAFSAAAGL